MLPLLIVGGALLLIILYAMGVFNKFAANRNTVQDAWSNIDVALKRRHDLIPNLVNTVKGYAKHESETFEKITQARAAAMGVPTGNIDQQIQAETQLTSALKSLFAVAEAYPELKANTNFMDLQHKLAEIEENLERSRRFYNATVRENNTYGESAPQAFFAGMLKYKHFNYFEVEASERANVDVNFD